MTDKNNFAAIVLAAGAGKRMKSQTPKVLHQIGGRSMVARTVDILCAVPVSKIVTVVSPDSAVGVKRILAQKSNFVVQEKPLGTADAARVGLKKVPASVQTVAVINGDDSAFYKPQTILNVYSLHQKTKSKITFVTLNRANPQGLGRVVRSKGKVTAIIEENDANENERKIKEINVGLYFFDKAWLSKNLPKLLPSPVTGEYYLTDLIKLALGQGEKIETYKLQDPREWHGINTPEELEEANRKLKTKIHIMGIAGAGASAVAGIAGSYGFEVSGCDLNPDSAYSKNLGITIKNGHSPNHMEGIDLLVISPAVTRLNPNSPEIINAKKLKIPVLTWQQFQGKYLQTGKFVIAVAGAYGKSTTTAMISQTLIDAGLDPICEVGAKVLSWGKNFKIGKSNLGPQRQRGPHGPVYFVCEADEYNNNFLNYSPDIAVILNIAWEHPDFFQSEKDIINSYQKFIGNIKPGGTLIISPQVKSKVKPRKDIRTLIISPASKINLSLIGNFRKENAAAALAVAEALNVDFQKAKRSIEEFTGLGRRLEPKGEINGVKFYDDYAVQPYTVKTTADALKEKFKEKKVLLVFEPHTFSRIETFFKDFVDALKKSNVDKIYITEVFAAREKGDKVALAQKLAAEIGGKSKFTGSLAQTVQEVKEHLKQFDIILSMGAGDVYRLYDLTK